MHASSIPNTGGGGGSLIDTENNYLLTGPQQQQLVSNTPSNVKNQLYASFHSVLQV